MELIYTSFIPTAAYQAGLNMSGSKTLREHLHTHETFTVDKILRDFLRNYH